MHPHLVTFVCRIVLEQKTALKANAFHNSIPEEGSPNFLHDLNFKVEEWVVLEH